MSEIGRDHFLVATYEHMSFDSLLNYPVCIRVKSCFTDTRFTRIDTLMSVSKTELWLLLQDLAGGGRGLDPQQSCPLTFEFVPTGSFGLDFKPCWYDSNQRKHHWDAWSPCVLATRKRKIINLNYFLFLLWWLLVFHSCSVEVNRCTISRNFPALRLFLHGTSFLLSKLLQAMLCDRSGIFKHPNDSLQWRTPFFSYIKCFLWNNVKSRRVLLASVKRNTK